VSDWRFTIALKYTQSSASDRLVSFMSFISVSGLVLGVAVLVIVLSVMNGFERELRLRVLGVLPHGLIFAANGYDNWHEVVERFTAHPEVSAAAPFLQGGGLVVANAEISGVSYFGVEPDEERKVSIINEFFSQGELSSLRPGTFHMVMGKTLANKLRVKPGDKVTLVLPDVQLTLAGPIPRTKRFTLSGIFEVGSDADKGQIFINLEDGLKLARKKKVDTIRITTNELFEAPRILRELVTSSGRNDILASSWMRNHLNLYNAIQMQKTTMFLLLLMLVTVAAFNVISNLVMVVNDKKPDIAILRTMGASTGDVMWIFILHGVLIGAIGVLLGIILGVLVTSYLTQLYSVFDAVFQLGLMDEYFIHYLPTQILLDDLVLIGSVALVICLVVTIYPALMASRSNPVEALQYE